MSFMKTTTPKFKDKVVEYLQSISKENHSDNESKSETDEDRTEKDKSEGENDDDNESSEGENDDEDDNNDSEYNVSEDDGSEGENDNESSEDENGNDGSEDENDNDGSEDEGSENDGSEDEGSEDDIDGSEDDDKDENNDETESDVDSISAKDEVLQLFTDEPFYHMPDFSSDIHIEGFDTLHVSICAYIINNNSYNDPYISFLLQYAEKTRFYSFLSFLYEPLNEINHHDFLKNKCLEIIYPIFNINPDDTEDMNEIVELTARAFKGYKHNTGTKEVIIGINVEDFIPYLNKNNHDHITLSQYFGTSEEYKWVVLSDIIDAVSMVDPTLVTLIKNNKKIYQIRNKHNTLAEIPKILYAYNNDKSMTTHFGKSINDEHGRIYLFSDKKQNDHETRFVVFPTIHYIENGVRYYGVLSQDKFQEF